jgi:hypothetical protein
VLQPFGRAIAAVASLELPVSTATMRVALGLSLVATFVVVASVFLVDQAQEKANERPAVRRRY